MLATSAPALGSLIFFLICSLPASFASCSDGSGFCLRFCPLDESDFFASDDFAALAGFDALAACAGLLALAGDDAEKVSHDELPPKLKLLGAGTGPADLLCGAGDATLGFGGVCPSISTSLASSSEP